MYRKSQKKFDTVNNYEIAFRPKNILHLLRALEIGTFASANILKEITHNPVNKSVLFEIQDDGCVGENQILLSVKKGQLTVDQVYNATYHDGADYSRRIIVFTGGDNWDDKYNPSADMDIVKCLVDNMNRFDLNIYLVKMVSDSTSSTCDYEVLAQPDSHPKFSISECPSKEKFTEAEFWEVYFWGYNNFIEATPFEFGLDSKSEFSQCFPIGDLEIETKWTDKGAIIRIEDTSDKRNVLGGIWDDRRNEIQDMFRGCEIELLIQAGETFKLIIKVFDKPIGDLSGVPWREKMHYAGLLWSKFIQFQGFIEKALQELNNNSEEIINGKTKNVPQL